MLNIEKIKERRHKLNLTQAQVAKKCAIAQSHYAQTERGTRVPSLHVLCSIVSALGLKIQDIVEVKKCYQQKVLSGSNKF